MAESGDSMCTEEVRDVDSPLNVKKPKKRSLVERELETNLTARITSPLTGDGLSTSRYGRARRLKTEDVDRKPIIDTKSPISENSPLKSPTAYKMHAINSPYKSDSPKRAIDTNITKQIDSIYQENISLSRFNDNNPTPAKKSTKVYTRKDLIQTKDDDDDDVILIKNLFSPTNSSPKTNINKLDSTEKYNNLQSVSSEKYKHNQNGLGNASVVKTLDFDDNKGIKKEKVTSKNDFEIEASCPYQVGDLAWARMGTFPFWPCIVTRDPQSGMFIKKKLFGRVQHDIIHVTFFGDNGRRSWIVDNMLRPYHGQQEFMNTRDKFTTEDKKKDPRLYAAFFISEKKQPLWNISVEEAEMLMKEPKRLRIDILNDMIHKARDSKKQHKGGKISRTSSDVSLSESLYDSLFSEDDSKTDDQGRLRSRSRNHKPFDVSEVVTACLDNMAAKTGITKIQRQSHMDRWLQKAKSKTPEKSQKITVKTERNTRSRKSKTSKKGGIKSHSTTTTTTDESNVSDQDVKNIKIETENVAIPAESLFEDITVKLELSEQENEKEDESNLNEQIMMATTDENQTKRDTASDKRNITVEESRPNEEDQGKPEDEPIKFEKIDGVIDTITELEEIQEEGVPNIIEAMEVDEKAKESIVENNSLDPITNIKDVIEEKKKDATENNKDVDHKTNEISNSIDIKNDQKDPASAASSSSKYNEDVSQNCEAMEIDATGTNEKPVAYSLPNILNNSDEKDNQSVAFLGDSPGVAHKHPDNSDLDHTTNFLDDDHNHLRDKNKYDGKTDNVSVKEFNDQKIKDRITEENVNTDNSYSVTDISDDDILNKINEVLNDGDDSQAMLQTGVLNVNVNSISKNDETEALNQKPRDIEEKCSESEEILNKNQQTDNALGSDTNKVIIDTSSEIMEGKNINQQKTAGSSTSKSDEIFVKHKETIIIIEEPYIEEYEIEESDDEPSPEYEPLGEDITEDFRKHMMCIEKSVTDTKDEEQIVKICDEITRTIKQEIIDSYSPKKDQLEIVINSKDANVLSSSDKVRKPREQNSVVSPHIKVLNESTPTRKSERHNRQSRSKDKSSDPLDRSVENVINECSLQEPINKKDTESITFSTTPRKTRSKAKKYSDKSKQDGNEISKTIHIRENGKIYEDKFEKHNQKGTQINGSIEEIYSQMCKNEPKVMLTPLKIKNHTNTPDTPNMKNKSVNKFKLSLKKIKSPENNPNAFYAIVDNECMRRSPKILPIENGSLETTIPISQQNGYHHNDEKITDGTKNNDEDFNIDATHSDDSEESVVIKTPRRSLRAKTNQEHAEFLHYLELRQDYLMDEYPELDEDEIEQYLHRTWEYEESLKCEFRKSDDIRHSNLVKGLKQESPNNKKSKKSNTKPNTIENYFRDRYHKKKMDIKSEPIVKAEDNLISDCQPGCSNSSDSGIESNKDKNEIENDTKIKTPTKLPKTIEIIDDDIVISKQIKTEVDITNEEDSIPKIPLKKHDQIKEEKDESESQDSDSEIPLRQLRSKVLKQKVNSVKSVEPSSIAKLKQESSEVITLDSDDEPLNKHLRKKKNDKKTDNSYENPDFVKFLELRQDALIDENPELSQEEIVDYLYKTWLYEESSKSEIKKNDEIEQSNLVKGLNQDNVVKKVKRKPRVEKLDKKNDDEVTREKPKRKTVQPFYNEEYYSDIEEEIELFEIFRKKTTKKEVKDPSVKEEQIITQGDTHVKIKHENTNIQSSIAQTNTEIDLTNDDEESVDEVVEILDPWEHYFADLLKPKPNVFKGLIREKVCEVCEKTGNLYKCKGCSGMFHLDCAKKVTKLIEINTPSRGRKKRKKTRKNKSLEDSESQGDEKCQDLSDDVQNMSVEEIITETCTFDAETLEAQISAKMQEMLKEDAYHDSYSSEDDGVDWSETVPGKCEIVDVKLKSKRPSVEYTNFKCNNCQEFDTPLCFVCKRAVSKNDVKIRQKCHVAHCHKYYHLECLDHWPQTQFLSGEPSKNNKKISEFFEALSCPRHVCHTCVSDDPRGCKTRFSGDKLARCVRCPATYHSFTKCLPAGSQILTASQIICPRHYQHRPGKVPCHVNTGWCFICALGGSLICCEYCPTSFHAECLNIKPPEGNYMCEDCETGRLPLYGEMVWVKLGHYRWWPGIILHPSEIPENIMAVKHSLGEFVVRFFGQYDHYWVNRGRVFPYQEGDSGRISNQKTKIDAAFTTAMEHAQRAFQILKNSSPNDEESLDIASSLLPPHYVKLRCNKPCGGVAARRDDPALSLTQCECSPTEADPCGPYSQCLNRMLLTECGPTCRAGDRCNNRAFEKRLYPKLVPYRTPHRGWGLKTLEDIKAGQFVIEYVGELIDEEEFRRRMRRKHEIRDENFYFLTLDKERMIDAGPKGNLARFMNHCCEPNCETQKWTVLGDIRVGLFALYDIPANSEVTFNYNLECAGIEKKRCMCGAKRCSGYIGAKPKQEDTKKSKDGKLKRSYKKRKPDDTNKTKIKKPLGRPPKPKELTEIEKDLLIIKSATTTSSGESSRSQSIEDKNPKLKRKRDPSTDDDKPSEPKKQKYDDVGD